MNATCQWNITAPVGKVVRIKLLVVYFSGFCSDEHFMIHDGPNNSSNIIAQYCNGTPPWFTYFISSGRSLFLEAKTGHRSSPPSIMIVGYHMLDFQGNSLFLYQQIKNGSITVSRYKCCKVMVTSASYLINYLKGTSALKTNGR